MMNTSVLTSILTLEDAKRVTFKQIMKSNIMKKTRIDINTVLTILIKKCTYRVPEIVLLKGKNMLIIPCKF